MKVYIMFLVVSFLFISCSEDNCWSCRGSGRCGSCNGDGRRTCFTCNGEGMVWEWIEGGQTKSQGRCRVCMGSGRITCNSCDITGRCVSCNGTGKRPESRSRHRL